MILLKTNNKNKYCLTNLYMNYIYKLILTAVMLFVVDLVWLFTGGTYALKLAENIQGSPITIRYQYMPIIYFFLSYMLLESKSYTQAFLFGVCIYGVYDFTTLGIFKKYDYKFGFADTIWGGILFVITKYILSI